MKIFSALEVEIAIDGGFKLDNGIIEYSKKHADQKKLGVDFLLGSIHSESFQEDCAEQKISEKDKRLILIENMCNLIRNKKIDIFAHPFQAIHGHFSDNLSESETDKIMATFKNEWSSGHNIFFEINGKKYPGYEQWTYNKYEKGEMGTNDKNFLLQYMRQEGKFVIGSDAHTPQGLLDTDLCILSKLNIEEENIFIFL